MKTKLKIIISGSRFSREREALTEILKSVEYAGAIDYYDCNEHVTNYTQVGKQGEINQRIRECDWYILLAPTHSYGKYTWEEWKVATNRLKQDDKTWMVTVFRCNNIDEQVENTHLAAEKAWLEELKKQGISPNTYGSYTFDDFKQEVAGGGNFEKTYDYQSGTDPLADFKRAVQDELKLALEKNLLLKSISTPLTEMKPGQVFANSYRVEEAKGFDENFYIPRSTVDGELDEEELFTIVLGAPASGKTRAVYEFLKRKAARSIEENRPIPRLISVKKGEMGEVLQLFNHFKEWYESLPHDRRFFLDDYYIVFDQISDVLYTKKCISEFYEFFRIAVQQLHAHVIATSLLEAYDFLKRQEDCIDSNSVFADVKEIRIARIDNEADDDFKDHLKDYLIKENVIDSDTEESINLLIRNKKLTGWVIGDYIKKLVEYNNTIKRNIESYEKKDARHNDLIKTFVQAFLIIRIFRRGNDVPLALVLSVMKQLNSENPLSKGQILDLCRFFAQEAILSIDTNERGKELEYCFKEKTYKYDDEMLTLWLPPRFYVSIMNDYIWEYLMSEYNLEVNKKEDMKLAMKAFYNAFGVENPLSTLRRIIARSPSVSLANKYAAQENFVWEFVYFELNELCENEELWQDKPTELIELIATLLHRSSSLDNLMQYFDEYVTKSNGRFKLDETVVAELMGFAQNRSKVIRQELKEFLQKKGWDFEQHHGKTLYYHRRQIQYMNTFTEVQEYVEKSVNPTYNDALKLVSIPGVCLRSQADLALVIIQKVSKRWHIEKLVEWMQRWGVTFANKYLFNTLFNQVKNSKVLQSYGENKAVLEFLEDYLLQEGLVDKVLLYYYLIDTSCCFGVAWQIYVRALNTLKTNRELHRKTISAMLKSARPDEFGIIWRNLVINGNEELPQVSRNILLSRLNVSDGLAILSDLFDRKSADSTPDVNTLINLLMQNKDFLSKAEYKAYKGNTNLKSIVFQNLLMILSHPVLKDIQYNHSALSYIIAQCLTEEQEEYVAAHFIKPDRLKTLKRDGERNVDERIINQEVDRYWEQLKGDGQIAVTRIRRRTLTDPQKIYEIFKKEMMRRLNSGYDFLDSNIVNVTLNKLVDLYFEEQLSASGKKRKEGECTENQDNILKYCKEVYTFIQNGQKENKYCIDYLQKDEYYYRAIYRTFPEKAVEKNKDTGKWQVKAEVFEIDRSFIDAALYSNILQGVALFMGEKVLKDIEMWFITNVERFGWDYVSSRKTKKLFPNYEFATDNVPTFEKDGSVKVDKGNCSIDAWKFLNEHYKEWKEYNENLEKSDTYKGKKNTLKRLKANKHLFNQELMDKITETARLNPDTCPNIELLHTMFKAKYIPSRYVLQMLEEIFLKQQLLITPSLWKSALESIKNMSHYSKSEEEKGIGWVIYAFMKRYNKLLLEDCTTCIYLAEIIVGIWWNDKKEKNEVETWMKECLAPIKDETVFKSVLDYSELLRIKFKPIYQDNINLYVADMLKYHELNELIYGKGAYSDTYSHFAGNCVCMFWEKGQLVSNETLQRILYLYDWIYQQVKDKENPKKWLENKLKDKNDDYRDMLNYLYDKLQKPIDHLLKLM